MLTHKRGESCDKETHKTKSSNRDIKDLGRYTPACESVAGSKEGRRKPPSPAATKNQNPDGKILLKGITELWNFYGKFLASIEGKPDKVLFKGRRTPNHFHIVDIYKDGKPYIRRIFQSDATASRVISEYVRSGYSILYRGIFYIPKEVWKEYKKRYKEVKENPGLSFKIFELSRLVKLGDSVLIDFDGVSEADIKRIVKYLHKLGIYPEVWLSASGEGYHLYIHLIYRVIKKRKVEEVDSFNGKIKQVVDEGKFYEFPYASDYRLKFIVEALKELCERLKIPYDSISAKRSVWLEGLYNPLKGGKSVKVFNGRTHRVDKVYKKLEPLWKAYLKKKVYKGFVVKRKPTKGFAEVKAEIENTLASNPVDYIQANLKNGTITRFLNAGYDFEEVGRILASYYEGDEKAFWRAWRKAEEHIRLTFKPLKPSKKKSEEERRHKHYWEYIPKIKKCLEEGITSAYAISKVLGIPKSSVLEIFRRFSKEQILNQTEEVIAYLKANQKGGNKLSTERNRELGKERFERYFEEYLKRLEAKRRKPVKERKVYLLGIGNKGIKDPLWREITLWQYPEKEKKTEPTQEGRDNLLIKTRTDRELSITPEGNGREGDGLKGLPKKREGKEFETKLGTTGVSHKRQLLETQPQMVEFYGKIRSVEEVERIKPLVVGRRINADSWKLYEEAFERLMLKGIPVWGGKEEDLKVEEEKEKPLIGEKLLRLIKFLYVYKFQQVDLRKKPTTGYVLSRPAVKSLDLGGWGRYAFAVYEVLKDLKLIDSETEVRFPKYIPVYGVEEIEITDLDYEEIAETNSDLEEEINQYVEEINTEEDTGMDEEELYSLIWGEEEEANLKEEEIKKSNSEDSQKEVLRLRRYIKTDLEFLSSEEKAKVLQKVKEEFGDFETIEDIVNHLEKTGDIAKLKELSELIQKVIFFGI